MELDPEAKDLLEEYIRSERKKFGKAILGSAAIILSVLGLITVQTSRILTLNFATLNATSKLEIKDDLQKTFNQEKNRLADEYEKNATELRDAAESYQYSRGTIDAVLQSAKNAELLVKDTTVLINEELKSAENYKQVFGELDKQRALISAIVAKDPILQKAINDALLQSVLPVGTILAYRGKLECKDNDSQKDIAKCISGGHVVIPIGSKEWYVCNGATLASGNVPDMKGRFLKMTSDIDELGGNSEIGSHTHLLEAGGPEKSNQRVIVKGSFGTVGTYVEYYTGTAITAVTSKEKDTTAQSNDPEYYGVVFIARIQS